MVIHGFGKVIALTGTYAAVSVATVGALVALHSHPAEVTPTAWVRGVIVALASIVTVVLARVAARGSRGAWLRLRIVSAVMLVAVAAFVAIPGSLPLWMKLEQAACGVLLVGVALIVNGGHARTAFART